MSVLLYSVNEVKRQFGRWAGETFSRKCVMAQEIGTLSYVYMNHLGQIIVVHSQAVHVHVQIRLRII